MLGFIRLCSRLINHYLYFHRSSTSYRNNTTITGLFLYCFFLREQTKTLLSTRNNVTFVLFAQILHSRKYFMIKISYQSKLFISAYLLFDKHQCFSVKMLASKKLSRQMQHTLSL